jgi:hypothetical protein
MSLPRYGDEFNCHTTFRTYTLGGESAVMSEHQASAVFGGDCSCYLQREARDDDARHAGPVAYYRFLRAEYPAMTAQRAWNEAHDLPPPPEPPEPDNDYFPF